MIESIDLASWLVCITSQRQRMSCITPISTHLRDSISPSTSLPGFLAELLARFQVTEERVSPEALDKA
jgi:hypothetical protein